MSTPKQKPGPGQESVWDDPRPPRLEPSSKPSAYSSTAISSHYPKPPTAFSKPATLPTWYIPPTDIKLEFLSPTPKSSFCEWERPSHLLDRLRRRPNSGKCSLVIPIANPPLAPIKGYLAFYPSRFECHVDDERVIAQPGDFYGGWITRDIVGPFKGIPGSSGW